MLVTRVCFVIWRRKNHWHCLHVFNPCPLDCNDSLKRTTLNLYWVVCFKKGEGLDYVVHKNWLLKLCLPLIFLSPSQEGRSSEPLESARYSNCLLFMHERILNPILISISLFYGSSMTILLLCLFILRHKFLIVILLLLIVRLSLSRRFESLSRVKNHSSLSYTLKLPLSLSLPHSDIENRFQSRSGL